MWLDPEGGSINKPWQTAEEGLSNPSKEDSLNQGWNETGEQRQADKFLAQRRWERTW